MKRAYDLDAYKLAEALSAVVWQTLISVTKVEELGPKLNKFINSTKA
jgi:hypothetical protein